MSRYYPNQSDLEGADRLERVIRDLYARVYSLDDRRPAAAPAAKPGVTILGGSPDPSAIASASTIAATVTGPASAAQGGLMPASPGDPAKFLNGAPAPAFTYPLLGYGSMYADEASITVTIAATNTYVHVPSGLTDGGSSAAFVFQNSKELRCVRAGVYLACWSMSINCATNSQDLSGCIMVGTTPALNTTSHNFNGVGASKNSAVAGTGILTLTAGNLVRLAVADHTAIHDIVVEHANLTLVRVG